MPKLPRFAAATFALTCALAISGCDTSEPEPSPEPTATDAPVFESEEEALAAATEAYAAYQAAIDAALVELDPSGLEDFAMNGALVSAQGSVEEYIERNHRQSGSSIISATRIVDAETANGSDLDSLQLYACLDVSGVEVTDATGRSILPPERTTVFPLIATLNWRPNLSAFLVSEEETWDGANFCA